MKDSNMSNIFGRKISKDAPSLSSRSTPPPLDTEGTPDGSNDTRNGDPKKLIDNLKERFEPRAPIFRLEDVILPPKTMDEVNSLIAKVQYHHTLYKEWGLSQIEPFGDRLIFNLYGQPGTGKTMLAEALADKFGKKVIEVNYAEIESKYVGDTPKNITAAFKSAKDNDAILFFDEADSILGKRMTNVTQAADHGVNVSRAVMLKQLDSFSGIVMFATNLAKNFDGAFVRRILFNIEIPVPDKDGRLKLWRKLIPDPMPGKEGLDFDLLAKESDGLVGGEIKNAVIIAATVAVQRDGSKQKITRDDLINAVGTVRKAKKDIGNYEYGDRRRHVTFEEIGDGKINIEKK